MGFWEALNSTTDAIKKNSPDLRTPVTNACKSSYNLGCAAVNTVKGRGAEYIPGPEAQNKIVGCVNNRATREGIKLFYPGATQVYNFASALLDQRGVHSLHDDKKSKKLQLLQADNERLRAENERLHAEHERIKALTLIALVPKRSFFPFYGSPPSQIYTKPDSCVIGNSSQIDSSQ